jgi:hypothetical protein
MARIRSIKPELRTSLTVSAWPMEVRYFFVLLWGYLDDYGRGVDDGLLIAADCFPRDRHITAEVVDGWLDVLEDSGPVHRYEVDGKPYVHCPSWSEHQKPQHPGKPRVPPCPECEPDPFDTWRADNPAPRHRKPSRRSHEAFMTVSPPLSGTLGGSEKGLQKARSGSENAVVIQLPGQTVIEDFADDEPADQDTSHDILMQSSGDSTETLTPEQVYRSREQGEGDRTSAEAGAVAIPRSEVEEACRLLADLIEANGSKRPAIGKRWHDDIRLMIDKDRVAPADVLAAIRWSQAHHFWRSNILSPFKLRKHYEAMRLQANPGTAELPPTGTAGAVSHNAGVLQRRRARREAQQ